MTLRTAIGELSLAVFSAAFFLGVAVLLLAFVAYGMEFIGRGLSGFIR